MDIHNERIESIIRRGCNNSDILELSQLQEWLGGQVRRPLYINEIRQAKEIWASGGVQETKANAPDSDDEEGGPDESPKHMEVHCLCVRARARLYKYTCARARERMCRLCVTYHITRTPAACVSIRITYTTTTTHRCPTTLDKAGEHYGPSEKSGQAQG